MYIVTKMLCKLYKKYRGKINFISNNENMYMCIYNIISTYDNPDDKILQYSIINMNSIYKLNIVYNKTYMDFNKKYKFLGNIRNYDKNQFTYFYIYKHKILCYYSTDRKNTCFSLYCDYRAKEQYKCIYVPQKYEM